MCLRFGLCVLVCVLSTSNLPATDENAQSDRLVALREQGLFAAQLIRSVDMSVSTTPRVVAASDARFRIDGDKFRVDRKDRGVGQVPPGLPVQTILPYHASSAFNGLRSQHAVEHDKEFVVKTGNESSGYNAGFPLTTIYSWLRSSSKQFRWETVTNEKTWEQRFQNAVYDGQQTLEGKSVEVVRFPPQESLPDKLWYRVYFDTSDGFLPVRSERFIPESNAVSTVMTVTQRKVMQLDGHSVCIPTEIVHIENGADRVSLIDENKMVVDVDSLVVNSPIDPAVFTLQPKPGWRITDIDELQRYEDELAAKAAAAKAANPTPSTGRRALPSDISWVWWAAAGLSMLTITAAVALRWRHKS